MVHPSPGRGGPRPPRHRGAHGGPHPCPRGQWQRDYGYQESHEPCPDCGNWLAPCTLRDHHADFLELVRRHEPAPTDEDTRAALGDSEYHEGLARFGREPEELTGPVWKL